MTHTPDKNRPIRSYVLRSGRLTDSQRNALDTHWDKHVIDYDGKQLQLGEIFTNNNPVTLEIGFGMGGSLLQMALDQPSRNFVGIEVHKPGVGKILQGIADAEITNLKIICHDAKEVLANSLADNSIDRLQLFFPDPWPKKKHNKRRIVQTEFIRSFLAKIRSGGHIHLATDWQAYAEHMMEVMSAIPEIENTAGKGKYWDNPERPVTKFETRGIRLGHGVWDLLFRAN